MADDRFQRLRPLIPPNPHLVYGIRLSLAVVSTLILAFCLAGGLAFLTMQYLGISLLSLGQELRVRVLRDVLALAFAALAAGGGVVALVVAYRRQRVAEANSSLNERAQALAEETAELSELDTTERRLAELHIQALERLGSTVGVVRLGAMYALERLGTIHSDHRQAVVDVICAYLRMPPQGTRTSHTAEEDLDTVGFEDPTEPWGAVQAARRASVLAVLSDDTVVARQELQVRLTATRLLTRHLRPARADSREDASDPFWSGLRVDLSGAVLIDADFGNCQLTDADFTEAEFFGPADFARATFNGRARFDRARFHGRAWFSRASMGERISFVRTHFYHLAWFTHMTVPAATSFYYTHFHADAHFLDVEFTQSTSFAQAKFDGNAWFDRITFHDGQDFSFENTLFEKPPMLARVHVQGVGLRDLPLPTGWRFVPESPPSGMYGGVLSLSENNSDTDNGEERGRRDQPQ